MDLFSAHSIARRSSEATLHQARNRARGTPSTLCNGRRSSLPLFQKCTGSSMNISGLKPCHSRLAPW